MPEGSSGSLRSAVAAAGASSQDDARNGKAAEKMQLVLRQLKAMTAEYPHHQTLPLCAMQGQDGKRGLQECHETSENGTAPARCLTSISARDLYLIASL